MSKKKEEEVLVDAEATETDEVEHDTQEQAPLALLNLLSSGLTMKEAKKKLGLD